MIILSSKQECNYMAYFSCLKYSWDGSQLVWYEKEPEADSCYKHWNTKAEKSWPHDKKKDGCWFSQHERE